MSITYRDIALYCVFLCLSAFPLHAQSDSTQSNHAVITSMTMEAFQQRVKELGFATESGSTDGKPATFFLFRAEGRKVAGMVINRDAVELLVSFTDGAALETVNEWNRTHYGTSAFVDSKGNAELRSDLVLSGGVSQENVDSFILRFRDMASAYARFIIDHKNKP